MAAWAYSDELAQLQAELRAYAASVTGDASAADDIVQEANLAIWHKREQFEEVREGGFRAWAFRITYFKALSHRRDQSRRGWLVFNDDLAQQIAEKAEQMSQGQNLRMEALQTCMEHIKPEQRHLLIHIYGSGESVAQYSKRHQKNTEAMYKTLQRLKKKLQDCVTRKMIPSPINE